MTRQTPYDSEHRSALLRHAIPGRQLDDCWQWKGAIKESGYGRIRVRSIEYIGSRLSYAVHKQEDPAELDVCHSCDNPICCNPRHLFLGTHQENIADAVAKGRWAHKGAGSSRNRGERNPMAKLTDAQISGVMKLRAAGKLQREIAAEFGVSQGYVSLLVRGKKQRGQARA